MKVHLVNNCKATIKFQTTISGIVVLNYVMLYTLQHNTPFQSSFLDLAGEKRHPLVCLKDNPIPPPRHTQVVYERSATLNKNLNKRAISSLTEVPLHFRRQCLLPYIFAELPPRNSYEN